MAEKENDWQPTWLYQMGPDKEIVAECFVDGPPEDLDKWYDSPEACKPRRGRPPNPKEDDSE